jgi:peptidoglycan/LPS O-acetylase OafA/YrhL
MFNNPAWSLDTELQYYLLVPLLVLLWKGSPKSLIAITVTAMLACLTLQVNPANIVDIDKSLLAWAAFFLAGFFLYQSLTLKSYCLKSAVAVFGGIIFTASNIWLVGGWAFIGGTIGLMLAASRFLVMQELKMFSKFDGTVGDLAYPFYILHMVVIAILSDYKFTRFFDSTLDPFLRLSAEVTVNFTITLFASYVALKFIDAPVRQFRFG